MDMLHQFRRYLTKPHVRPWALLAPILVLLVCLPMLRPLRHPDPRDISNDELARLATVQSLVERRTLAIDTSREFVPSAQTVSRDEKTYSTQPPTLSVLLAGPYWVLYRAGMSFKTNPALVAYLLTLIGATIPVAASAGMIYRMGRLFELSRKKRALLGGIVVFGGGLVSYGTVINPHAPAAALLLGATACIIHVAIARRPTVTSGWLAISGLFAGLAATINPPVAIFTFLLACAIPVMRWHWTMRVGGVLLFALGVAPAVLLHAMLSLPVTGSIVPDQLRPAAPRSIAIIENAVSASSADELDDLSLAQTWWNDLGKSLARVANALLGEHGVFSHFPVVILGAFGIAAVMHRHWPKTTKVLAGGTAVGAVTVLLAASLIWLTGPGKMFGPETFIVFLPLLLFWTGAWMRRPHRTIKWTMAGVLLAFSATVSILGATNPMPREGYTRYTAGVALNNLIHPQPNSPSALAGR